MTTSTQPTLPSSVLETAKQVAHKQVSDNGGVSIGAGMGSETEMVVVDDPMSGQEIKLPMMMDP